MQASASPAAIPSGHGDIKRQFAAAFGPGGKLHVVRAPGRVNLIGEHTDYNDGFVCPMAIEPDVRIVCRTRDDGLVRLASTAFPGQVVEFSTQQRITPGEPRWANYSKGVVAELIAAGVPLPGMDALLSNTLPIGGGLSSSAAVEVATARAMLALAGLDMDESRLALLCQKAEHEYAGAPVGIMDMTIVISGRVGHAMLLDCRDYTKQFVPLDPAELRVVIVNSMVKHELSGGEYAERRQQCEQAVRYFQTHYPGRNIKALRDVTMEMIEAAAREGRMDGVVLKRTRHVVGENARATSAARLLEHREYEEAGELMVQSHNSLRDDYEVSTPELDFLAAEAMKVKGVYGARMTGGGFGGCIVALTQPRASDAAIDHLRTRYRAQFNIDPVAFVTTATAGASVLE
jgi:galactokinase